LILGRIASQVESSIKDSPIDFVIGALEVPVQHDVGRNISVSERVACW
jgi:hypothetical protein